MKKADWPILVLAGAILASAVIVSAGLFSGGRTGGAASPQPDAAYRLEKLNEVNDMVLRREAVPEDYLRYLSESLAEEVRAYNQSTASMEVNYSDYAIAVANSLFYEIYDREDPGDYERPELYYQWVGRITRLALYRNTYELCLNDPLLIYPLSIEAGGSYGMWPLHFHEHIFNSDAEYLQMGEDYFSQIDLLLTHMDGERAALAVNSNKD